MQFIAVVLPAPLCPRSAKISPNNNDNNSNDNNKNSIV